MQAQVHAVTGGILSQSHSQSKAVGMCSSSRKGGAMMRREDKADATKYQCGFRWCHRTTYSHIADRGQFRRRLGCRRGPHAEQVSACSLGWGRCRSVQQAWSGVVPPNRRDCFSGRWEAAVDKLDRRHGQAVGRRARGRRRWRGRQPCASGSPAPRRSGTTRRSPDHRGRRSSRSSPTPHGRPAPA